MIAQRCNKDDNTICTLMSAYLLQGRNNLSKTEGAAHKLWGRNIKNELTFYVFGMTFREKR